MKLLMSAVLIGVLLGVASPVAASDAAFVETANAFIAKLVEMNPEYATGLGDHRYDGKLNDRSMAGIGVQTKVAREYLDRLSKIDSGTLSEVNAIDYSILKLNLERMIFENEELKEHEWNPLYYNMGNAIYSLVARDFAPLSERLGSVKSRLEGVPAVVGAAKANLKNPPKVFTETAIL
jgi:uncharacterized protein (DUF885 family)